MIRPYTVVGYWPNGGTFVEHFSAKTPQFAARMAKLREDGTENEDVEIYAIFDGHLTDLHCE